MSEGDVSLIRDEDVLRRLWQQTEDFSRKKEIRAHMYRLREERLRDLYTPEPLGDGTKGCEFTSPQGHVQSFVDQNFQSMKSKEVRDAGSPPKDFIYSGQDLKELSNAGWNVESENRTTDDGHTHVKSINANIEGTYDVDGGKGKFAAVDQHTQAVTEYQDENSSLKRNERSSKTAAHEQVVQKTDDGSHLSSTKSTSSSSKYEQVSTRHETVPYTDDYDQRTIETNKNEQLTRDNYEQTLSKNDGHGELISRKVEYPDDNTRVIVETRRLPDGTRLTSTRREFRAPMQSTRSEHHTQSRSENKYSSTHRSDQKSSSKIIHHIDSSNDIVDSQKNVDNHDFKKHIIDEDKSETQSVRNFETNTTSRFIDTTNDDSYSTTSRHETSRVSKKIIDDTKMDSNNSTDRFEKNSKIVIDRNQTDDVYIENVRDDINKKLVDQSNTDNNFSQTIRYVTKINQIPEHLEDNRHPNRYHDSIDNADRHEITVVRDDKNIHQKDIKNTEDRIHTVTRDSKEHIIDRKTITDQYQTTYHSDYTQKKISTDWSPTHQAWASTLRSDTPPTTRPSTRASSPGSKTFKSSNSSLRSSISPDKASRKPSSRGNSPSKVDRYSPSRTVSDKYSSTHSTHSGTEVKSTKHTSSGGRPPTGRSPTRPGESPDRKPQYQQRPSVSPDKHPHDYIYGPSVSPERKPSQPSVDAHRGSPLHSAKTTTRTRQSPDRKPGYQPTSEKSGNPSYPRTISPQRYFSDKKPDGNLKEYKRFSPSPERKSGPDSPTDLHSTPSNEVPRTTSPPKSYNPEDTQKRPSVSPDRKPACKPFVNQPENTTHKIPQRNSTSPDRKTKYIKSTVNDQPNENLKSSTDSYVEPDFIPTKITLENREHKGSTRIEKVKEDHYKFIDEETKVYTKTDKIDNKVVKPIPDDFRLHEKSPSPIRKVPGEKSTDTENKLRDTKPFEQHGQKITIGDDSIQNKFDSDKTSETIKKSHDVTKNVTIHSYKSKEKPKPDREPSPTKFSTYDKRRPDSLKDLAPEEQDKPKHLTNRELSPTKCETYKKLSQDNVKDSYPKSEYLPKSQLQKELTPTKCETFDQNKTENDLKDCSPKSNDRSKLRPNRELSPTKPTTYNKERPQGKEPDSNYNDKEAPKSQLSRGSSPTKLGIFDKKQTQDKSKDYSTKDIDRTTFCQDREHSPTKYGTYDKKRPQDVKKDSIPGDKHTPKAESNRKLSPTKCATVDTKHNILKSSLLKGNDRELSPNYYETPDENQSEEKLINRISKEKLSPNRHSPQRQTSPTKYDKKLPFDDICSLENSAELNEITATKEKKLVFTKKIIDTKYESSIGETQISKQSPERPASPSKKAPRNSVSPVKSPTKDSRYKHNTNFLITESNAEDMNKRDSAKTRPRQLVTPSSSPTRKIKPETEPSTGHSSPTTSASGFVYHGSPGRENTEITDLDGKDYSSETTVIDALETSNRPETLNVQHRSPSPSKIPCRSPSPEKRISPSKDSIPRKSSLKKHSEPCYGSPTEKPPSSFHVSPTNDKDHSYSKIMKEDRPEPEGKEKAPKPKTPLERRETYEDRCKKILGMMDVKESVTKLTMPKNSPDTNLSSPSVSLPVSSALNDSLPLKEKPAKKHVTDVTDFILHEKEDIIKTNFCRHVPADEKANIPTTNSVTKLQDIITVTKSIDKYDVSKTLQENPDKSPEYKPSNNYDQPDSNAKTTCKSPMSKKTKDTKPYFGSDNRFEPESPSRHGYGSVRDYETISSKTADTTQSVDKYSKESFSRSSLTPERKSSNVITTTVTSKNTTSSIVDEKETVSSTTTENKYINPAESPSNHIHKSNDDQPRAFSPAKYASKEDASHRDVSPTKQSTTNIPTKKSSNILQPQTYSTNKRDTVPGYMKTTASVTSRNDLHDSENIRESNLSKTLEERFPRKGSESPKRKTSEDDKLSDIKQSKVQNSKDNISLSIKESTSGKPEKIDSRERTPVKFDKYPAYNNASANITKRDTKTTSQDIEQDIVTETVNEKSLTKTSESSTTRTPRDDELKNSSPSRSQNIKVSTPEERKDIFSRKTPTGRCPEDSSPTSPRKSPGYMKSTTSYTSKYDTVEDVEKTSTRILDKHIPRSLDSPLSQNREPGNSSTDYPKSTSPSKSGCLKDDSTLSDNKKIPVYADEKSSTRKFASCDPETGLIDEPVKETYKYPKNTSPTSDNEIITNSQLSSKCEITNTSEEIVSTKTVNRKHITTQSPIRGSLEHLESGPQYPREESPDNSSRPKQKSPTRDSISPERKYIHEKSKTSFDETLEMKPDDTYPYDTTPSGSENIPGYMRTTTSLSSKYDKSPKTDNTEKTITTTHKNIEKHHVIRSHESNPSQQTREHKKPSAEQLKPTSPLRSKQSKNNYPGEVEIPKTTPGTGQGQDVSVATTKRIPSFVESTKVVTTKHVVNEQTDLRTSEKKQKSVSSPSSKIMQTRSHYPRTTSPTKTLSKDVSPLNKSGFQQPSMPSVSPTKKSTTGDKYSQVTTPINSQDKISGHLSTTVSKTSKYETNTLEDLEDCITFHPVEQHQSPRQSLSPTKQTPEKISKSELHDKPEEIRQLRTPSPIKKVTKINEVNTDFIASEREKEILDKVQKSLRKLSPEPKTRSPSPEKSLTKVSTSLYDLDTKTTINTKESISNENTETTENITKIRSSYSKSKEEKFKEPKSTGKSRTVSTTKKSGMASPIKSEKSPESPINSRSVSPKKPFGERPQSPHVMKTGSVKPKEQVPVTLTRKPTPITITTTKIEKAITMDVKKTIGATKQNITKTSVKATASKFMSPTKTEPEAKRIGTPNAVKGYPKKDTDIKVNRITTDSKKTMPHRTKSKPEIQVNDLPTVKTLKSPKSTKEPQTKFPGKPKSATSLNTSTDEDDIIIDVQQSKSSRENSPDRICPTPVNFSDDVGTPRFPDQVSEPDDDLRKRTHHTIHETESLVDDIIEICEEDELFAKKTNAISEHDESLLSVHDKVSKFTNKIETASKLKDQASSFKGVEVKRHSDFIDENTQSDECLLSVSEKVNKFAKGPSDSRDSKSPSRKIVDEYDKHTVYQDDYTRLSVNDKAHLFVETAENVRLAKTKPTQKVERPDLSNVDESLKSDDCLLSVSDKVNKFVKTAEQFFIDTHEVEEKDKKIKEQHDKIMRQIVDDYNNETTKITEYTEEVLAEAVDSKSRQSPESTDENSYRTSKLSSSSQPKVEDYSRPNVRTANRDHPVKITTLRSSEAVKKAKALFENIASTTPKSKDSPKLTTKLTDIGIKKVSKTITPTDSESIVEDSTANVTNLDTVCDTVPEDRRQRTLRETPIRPDQSKHRNSPSRHTTQSPEVPRVTSPIRHTVETTTTTKTVFMKDPVVPRSVSPRRRQENEKPDKTPGYLRPTKTSQIKDEKVIEEIEISSRRGSGKFGVELRKTSIDRVIPTSERRRSLEHPCIEDIFDLDLLEQMLEKVVGYEQRRRIRAQIRVARKRVESNAFTKSSKETLSVQKCKSPERSAKSPQKTLSPDRKSAPTIQTKEELVTNGHSQVAIDMPRTQRSESPEKESPKSSKISSRQSSPEKKVPPQSSAKMTAKPKPSRFNEYATAYMKKVGLNEVSKSKTAVTKKDEVHKTTKHIEEHTKVENYSASKFITERTSSKDVMRSVQENGKRTPSPGKRRSSERNPSLGTHERSPSPGRRISDAAKETTLKTVYDIDKKTQPKVVQEEKPSWVTNRNLKKITSETRTFSSKKIETEKPKLRAASPSKVISKPIDAITSSYGPGPLDSDGKPLFGIRALRNGANNYQVKGTVIRQEFHSRNGGDPEGTVSVTAYSTEPEDLEKLLQSQGAPPSRLHGLAAITTTKKFGGDSGATIQQAHGKEERAALEQFTHSDRRLSNYDLNAAEDSYDREVSETRRATVEEIEDHADQGETVCREKVVKAHRTDEQVQERKERMEIRGDKKTVRQSSVKSLTEKFIKNANESSKTDRSSYPKAGLILRTAAMKDSISSDSSAHAGLARTDSEQSLGSVDDTVVTTTTERVGDGVRTTTTTTTTRHHERSFLDNSSKVTGVQDILTRMKNADIVIQEGDTTEDTEARALLNKFLGASVLMAGMQGYVTEKPSGTVLIKQETVRSGDGKVSSSHKIEEFDLDQCWDEHVLKQLLEECTDYEQRRRLRSRIRTLMAEQEACTSAVTEALSAAGEEGSADTGDNREEAEVTVTSSVRRDSSEKTVSSTTTTKTSKVVESATRPAAKPVSPFAKFRQLEKQNSSTSPNSPKTPQSPGSPSQPYFKFTDPALQASALTIKERLLQWCRDKTRDYENVKLENFSTSWADGLAFCALLHHFMPEAFDYSQLTADKRRHNFTLAFKIADEKAGIYPLLDVDDMVTMRKPDWKCVFTYVQSIHRRFKDQD